MGDKYQKGGMVDGNGGDDAFGGVRRKSIIIFTLASHIENKSGIITFFTDSGLTVNSPFPPSEQMRITSAGNIGIGTSTPGSKLDVFNGGVTSSGTSGGRSPTPATTGRAWWPRPGGG